MNRQAIFIILLLVTLVLPNLVFAQISTPKYSNEFLTLGVGAQGIGMSNAQVSVTNDVTAGYWNPAGLTGIAQAEGSLMHAEYFRGLANYNYGAAAIRIDSASVLGVSFIRYAIDNIPNTLYLVQNGQIDYSQIRRFSSGDNAVYLSYARQLPITGLSVGGNFKIIYRSAGSFANAWGFGLDAALQYKHKNWRAGAVLRDMGTFTAWTYNTSQIADVFAQTGNTIPSSSVEATVPRLSLGLGKYFPVGNANKFGALLAIDADFTFDGRRNVLVPGSFTSIDPKAGIELNYAQLAFLRFGAGQIQKIKNIDGSGTTTAYTPTFGLGIKIKRFYIDYALTNLGNQNAALYSNIFSLKVLINK